MQTQNLSKVKTQSLSHRKLLNTGKHSQIVYAVDFNFFFNCQLEADGGNPNCKSKSAGIFFETKETFDLCDI